MLYILAIAQVKWLVQLLQTQLPIVDLVGVSKYNDDIWHMNIPDWRLRLKGYCDTSVCTAVLALCSAKKLQFLSPKIG